MFKMTVKAVLLAATCLCSAPVFAQDNAGAYLAARQAAFGNDFAAAADYFSQSLRSDPTNPGLLENLLNAQVSLGHIDDAALTAQIMLDNGVDRQIANLVLSAVAAKQGDWDTIFETLEAGQSVSPLVDGLTQAWASLGRGNMNDAVASFDAVIETEGMAIYGRYHKAMALAVVGDYEGADAIMGAPAGSGAAYSPRAAIAHAKILSQLGRNPDALANLDAVFGNTTDPTIVDLRLRLSAGETIPYDVITTAQEGIGEISFMVAGLLRSETPDSYTLLYARVAEYLDPANTAALITSGDLLEQLERYELADEAFARIAPTDPAFSAAELGRVDVLRKAGKDDAAIAVAQSLTRSHADLPHVHAKLGDVLRTSERYDEAIAAYDEALRLYPDTTVSRWFVHYTRAITHHLVDQWPEAEADFRAALALNPDQPQVLNYLGYSLVERGEKLDEALEMIEKAVASEPENGAIVDSLGWVYFQLGRYEESVAPLEKAASLEATDPIINDHLGDALWAVGRRIEATFQWNRALSFSPDDELAERIRLKLEIGLDAVLESEGADPIQLANDDG